MTGKVALWLRLLLHRTQVCFSKPAVTSSSRGPNAFFQHLWALHARSAHTYMEANSHTYKIKFLNHF